MTVWCSGEEGMHEGLRKYAYFIKNVPWYVVEGHVVIAGWLGYFLLLSFCYFEFF